MFTDVCLLGPDSEGCGSAYPPAEKAFPAIDHLTIAFYRSALGIDTRPIGLDTRGRRVVTVSGACRAVWSAVTPLGEREDIARWRSSNGLLYCLAATDRSS